MFGLIVRNSNRTEKENYWIIRRFLGFEIMECFAFKLQFFILINNFRAFHVRIGFGRIYFLILKKKNEKSYSNFISSCSQFSRRMWNEICLKHETVSANYVNRCNSPRIAPLFCLFFPINCFYQCFENFTYKLLETGWSLRVISRRIKLDFAKNFLSKVWITIINELNGSCRTKFHGISNLFVVFRVTIARRINFFHASNQPRNIFLFMWI